MSEPGRRRLPRGVVQVPGLSPAKPPEPIVGFVVPARYCKRSKEYRPLRRPDPIRPVDTPERGAI